MSEDTEFRKTGSGFMMMEPRDQLKTLLREHGRFRHFKGIFLHLVFAPVHDAVHRNNRCPYYFEVPEACLPYVVEWELDARQVGTL